MAMNMFAHLWGGGKKPQAAPPGKGKGAKVPKPERGAKVKAEVDDTEEEAADDTEEEAAEEDGTGDDAEDDTDGDTEDDAEEEAEEEADAQAIAAAVRKAVADERKRCAAIFAAPAAAGNVPQACVLAFNTNLSAKQAIAVLASGSAGPAAKGGGSLSAAMRSVQVPPLGGGDADAGDDDAVKMLSAAVSRSIKDMKGNAK